MDETSRLADAILRADAAEILDIVSAEYSFSDTEIFQLLCETSVSSHPREIVFSGSGGTGCNKPNYTSLTAIYFAAAGHDVLKFGSRKVNGIFGSTDFFEQLGLSNLHFRSGGCFRYYDVNEAQRWHRYRNLLSLNRSFEKYFSTTIFNPIPVSVKLAFVAGRDCARAYGGMRQSRTPDRTYVICSEGSGGIPDEAGSGSVFADGMFLCRWDNMEAPAMLTPQEVFKTDMRLLTGLDETVMSQYLINNMAVSLALFDGVSLLAAQEECHRWYRDRIVLSLSQDPFYTILQQVIKKQDNTNGG